MGIGPTCILSFASLKKEPRGQVFDPRSGSPQNEVKTRSRARYARPAGGRWVEPKSVDDALRRLAEDERRSASNLIEMLFREAADEDHDVAEDPIRPRTIRLRTSVVADLRRLAKVEGRSTNNLIEI